ncbi:MAG: outer membrane protein assembly factor BamD, partial [Verrucomicrobiota bacterium]
MPHLPKRRLLVFSLSAILTSVALTLPAGSELRVKTDRSRAQALFEDAQKLIAAGKHGDAISKLRIIVDAYSDDSLAPTAQMKIARLYNENHENVKAFDSYQIIFDHFQKSDHYQDALDGQIDIAERVMSNYELRKRKGDHIRKEPLPSENLASKMFGKIVQNGQFAPQAPFAQYNKAIALEREEKPRTARGEHQVFLEKYPSHHLADDAAFQIAYIDYKLSRKSNDEPSLRRRSQLEFEYFLQAFPESEKTPQAKMLVRTLNVTEFTELIETAQYYEDRDRPQSALKYYEQMQKLHPAD